jgi:hypothetical protein
MKTNIHFLSYLARFFLEWEMFQTKLVEEFKTHIFCSVTFFSPKVVPLMRKCGKYCRVGQATDDSVAHAFYTLDTLDTLRLCNTHWFSTATVVARTLLNVNVIHTLPVLLHHVIHCGSGKASTVHFFENNYFYMVIVYTLIKPGLTWNYLIPHIPNSLGSVVMQSEICIFHYMQWENSKESFEFQSK